MKILHTADLHIGKSLLNESLLDQQKYVLEQLTQFIDIEKPDVLILAGDLFDHARPSAEAIRVLHNFLDEVINTYRTKIFAISGNHDGAEFLNFGSSFMQGMHMVTQADQMFTPFEIADEAGNVQFFLLPFLTPAEVRSYFESITPADEMPEIKSFDQAMEVVVGKINEMKDPKARHVIVAHGLVTSIGEMTPEQIIEAQDEGERLISIGGTECIDIRHLSPFHYVALGHLHGAHKIKVDHVRYAGSIYKYSKSESRQKKSFTVVNLQSDGTVSIELRPFQLKRDVREIQLSPEQLLPALRSDDYVFVKVAIEVITAELTQKVKAIFPNALQIQRVIDSFDEVGQAELASFYEGKDTLDHLREFFQSTKEKPLAKDQEDLFVSLWENVTGGVRG